MNNEGWGENPATIGHNSGENWTDAQGTVEPEKLETFEIKYEGQPETEEPEAFRMRRNSELQNWLDEKKTLENSKEVERSSRDKITSTLFPTPKKGTQRYDIGGGFKVKLVHTLTAKLGDKDAINESGEKITIEKQIRDMENKIVDKFGEVGEALLQSLITWTPTLSMSAFEKMDMTSETQKAVKLAIQEHLTVSPGAPQLTFEEPKE